MMRSLFSGVSGLRNHQTRMDVIGNNIANVNTTGFKASRVNFQDILSQTIQGASAPQGNRGGTNPKQVGLGMGVASIDTIFTDGSYQTTGKQTDLAIQGQGFFVLSNGANKYYTRAGNFDFDEVGNYLVPGTGLKVMGWMADDAGTIDTNKDAANIQIPVGSTMEAKNTSSITYKNNLSAGAKSLAEVLAAANAAQNDVTNSTAAALIQATDVHTDLSAAGSGASATTIAAALAARTAAQAADTAAQAAITAINTAITTPTAANQAAAVTAIKAAATAAQAAAAAAATAVTEAQKDTLTPATLLDDVKALKDTMDSAATKTATTVTGMTAAQSSNVTTSITVYDKQGNPYNVSGSFSKTGVNTWTFTPAGTVVDAKGNQVATVNSTPSVIKFDANGAYLTAGSTANVLTINPAGGPFAGAGTFDITPDFSTLTQYGSESTARATAQDGWADGTLDGVTLDTSGTIIGKFTNGKSKDLGRVALAVFNNPAGLLKASENMFVESNNSGVAQIGVSDSGGRGTFSPGSLEMSNVDLAQQFSDMIITQRGFQANSKIITTTDEMLELLANLKR